MVAPVFLQQSGINIFTCIETPYNEKMLWLICCNFSNVYLIIQTPRRSHNCSYNIKYQHCNRAVYPHCYINRVTRPLFSSASVLHILNRHSTKSDTMVKFSTLCSWFPHQGYRIVPFWPHIPRKRTRTLQDLVDLFDSFVEDILRCW